MNKRKSMKMTKNHVMILLHIYRRRKKDEESIVKMEIRKVKK
jgi:hypothetical protein